MNETQKWREMTHHKIFILLTQMPDNGSKVIRLLTRFSYTHVSIGLEEDMNTFYSFVTKGFIVESVTRYVKPDREPFPCMLYEMEVSKEVYQSIREMLHRFVKNKKKLHYSYLGVVLVLMHIPYKGKNHYFCSQFVAEILKYSKAACLQKDSALYLPKDFQNLRGIKVRFRGNLLGMLRQFHIEPLPA